MHLFLNLSCSIALETHLYNFSKLTFPSSFVQHIHRKMALNFDKKLMKVADEFADFDLLKTKDQPGPRFQTQETESMFILSVQLQGLYEVDMHKILN